MKIYDGIIEGYNVDNHADAISYLIETYHEAETSEREKPTHSRLIEVVEDETLAIYYDYAGDYYFCAVNEPVYNMRAIAKGLQQTAQGEIYDGNSLYVSKDIKELTPDDVSILEDWLSGRNALDPVHSRMRLQDIAIKIAAI